VIITDLLGSRVFGPDFLGFVSDVRFILESESAGQPARLYGTLVRPHARSSSLGFERSGVRSPWPIAALVRWRHRGSTRCRPDPAQTGIRAGFAGASLISNF
jgi:hypothetical protein